MSLAHLIKKGEQVGSPISNSSDRRVEIGLLALSWPILIENLIRISLNSADVFMLSWYSEKAVAAVGLINQFIFFLQLLYLMVASGSGILISQNIGAGREKDAGLVGLASLQLAFLFASVLSVWMALSANTILELYKLDAEVHRFAWQFLTIYGATSVFVAVGMVFSTILRAYGYTYQPMIVNIIALLLNVTGNYISIYGPFGLPVTGVVGVAWSTAISQAMACMMMFFMIIRHNDIHIPFRRIFRASGNAYRQILAIGVPSAGENISYNIGQIVIMRMIAALGTEAMAATTYSLTLLRYVFITSISIGNGAQIKVGYLVGAGRSDEAQRKVYRYFMAGFLISLSLVIVTKIAQVPLVHLFTDNATVQRLVYMVLIVALIHEPGRAFNVIIIPALKGAGDIRFPVYVGMIFMWGVGVLFAYIFGIALHWGLLGIWIALAADEWIRGLVVFFRWHNGGWRNKCMVKA
jgi:putative MATE family efflux protein